MYVIFIKGILFFFANNSALLEDVGIIENLLCMYVGVCVCS